MTELLEMEKTIVALQDQIKELEAKLNAPSRFTCELLPSGKLEIKQGDMLVAYFYVGE
jgi:hypothetical protein